MLKKHLSPNELATIQWRKLIKHEKSESIRRRKAEKYFASKRKFKMELPPIRFITGCVAEYYDIPYLRLKKSERNAYIYRYRLVLFYICKRVLGYSFRNMAKEFKVNSSNIFRALKKFKDLMLSEPKLENDIRAIRFILNRKYAK